MADNPKLEQFRNRLEHWRMPGSIYFVTWRVHQDQEVLTPGERTLVGNVIQHFNGDRYSLYAYVVMDDHVHVVVQPADNALSSIMHSWKSFSANQLHKQGRNGSVWQKDTFERIIRDPEELATRTEYVLNNARKRWPDIAEYQWMEWFKEQF